MPDWRTKILKEITKTTNPITLVTDPDNLLGDPKIQARLREEGYETYKYTDHIQFRYTFETRIRNKLQTGETKLVILTDIPAVQVDQSIPYDVIQKSEKVQVSLRILFPNLDYSTLLELTSSGIDRLYAAYWNYRRDRLGQGGTKEFLLRTVYQIDPQSILNQADYVYNLIKASLHQTNLPESLHTYLNEHLKRSQLSTIQLIENEHQLYLTLQKEWENYVNHPGEQKQSIINNAEIRPLILECIYNNKLQPIPVPDIKKHPKWMHLGLVDNTQEYALNTMENYLQQISTTLQSSLQLTHRDWQNLTYLWSQVVYLQTSYLEGLTPTQLDLFQEIEQALDEAFIPWIIENHQSLYYVREKKPVTLSHIHDHLSRAHGKGKTAILIIDGMSYDQYLKIKNTLDVNHPNKYRFEETCVFASIPTITSVSRQTIITGNEPLIFKNQSQVFNKEEGLWVSNWQKKGITSKFFRGLKLMSHKEIININQETDKQSLLLITDYLDKKIHEASNGKHEVYREIEYWLENSKITEIIDLLLAEEYNVYVTSDHGNVESRGIGDLRQHALSEYEGSRVRMYEERVFAEQAQNRFKGSLLLPKDKNANCYYLYAPDRRAFSREGEQQVTHGGLTLEEVIVPFVRVERKDEA